MASAIDDGPTEVILFEGGPRDKLGRDPIGVPARQAKKPWTLPAPAPGIIRDGPPRRHLLEHPAQGSVQRRTVGQWEMPDFGCPFAGAAVDFAVDDEAAAD